MRMVWNVYYHRAFRKVLGGDIRRRGKEDDTQSPRHYKAQSWQQQHQHCVTCEHVWIPIPHPPSWFWCLLGQLPSTINRSSKKLVYSNCTNIHWLRCTLREWINHLTQKQGLSQQSWRLVTHTLSYTSTNDSNGHMRDKTQHVSSSIREHRQITGSHAQQGHWWSGHECRQTWWPNWGRV